MSKDLNQCNFIGRLGKDPEVKYMPNGNAVTNISIGCNDDYRDNNGNKVEQTNWINIVAFGKLAEIIGEYLRKGSKVFVSGKQTTRKWQDKNGTDHYSTEIIAGELQMLSGSGGKPKENNRSQSNSGGNTTSAYDTFDDDIPF